MLRARQGGRSTRRRMVDATGMPILPTGSRVFVAGHRGLVGQAVLRRLAREPVAVLTASRADLDLRRSADVERWFAAQRPDRVVMAAAVVGGIADNIRRPGDFLHDNLAIQTSVIEGGASVGRGAAGVPRVRLHVSPRCAAAAARAGPMGWPSRSRRTPPTPSPSGRGWPCARPYRGGSTAAISSRWCRPILYRSVGSVRSGPRPRHPGPDPAPDGGPGRAARPRRRSGAAAGRGASSCTSTTSRRPWCGGPWPAIRERSRINIRDRLRQFAIADLARLIAGLVGYRGRLVFDRSRPDGIPVRRLDTSRAAAILNWQPRTGLRDGLAQTIELVSGGGGGPARQPAGRDAPA